MLYMGVSLAFWNLCLIMFVVVACGPNARADTLWAMNLYSYSSERIIW
jgi:hypothetical protein